MRISKITFSDDSEVTPSNGVNLIVGGNNTGKSTLINELGRAISDGYIPNSTAKWIKQVSLTVQDPKEEISSMFEEVENGHISIRDLGNIERSYFTLKSGFKPNRQNVLSLDRLDSFNANELERIVISGSRTLNIDRGSGKKCGI